MMVGPQHERESESTQHSFAARSGNSSNPEVDDFIAIKVAQQGCRQREEFGELAKARSIVQTSGIRAKLLQYSREKRKRKVSKQLPQSRFSSTTSLKQSEKLSRRESRKRSGSISKFEAGGKSGPMAITVPSREASEQAHPELTKSVDAAPQSHPQSVFVSASFAGKMKAKQAKGMKGMISGVGKELKRVATSLGDTVQERIPSSTNKKNKAAKERQLLMGDTQKPQVRNPDEIKRAYGHTTDASHAAEVAHDKLRERGKKLSAIQDRTAALEADAASFASLAQELQRKMENRKWYEI